MLCDWVFHGNTRGGGGCAQFQVKRHLVYTSTNEFSQLQVWVDTRLKSGCRQCSGGNRMTKMHVGMAIDQSGGLRSPGGSIGHDSIEQKTQNAVGDKAEEGTPPANGRHMAQRRRYLHVARLLGINHGEHTMCHYTTAHGDIAGLRPDLRPGGKDSLVKYSDDTQQQRHQY